MNIITLDKYKEFAGSMVVNFQVDTKDIFLGTEHEVEIAKAKMQDWVKTNPMPKFLNQKNYDDYQLSGCGISSILFVLFELGYTDINIDELLEFSEKYKFYDRWAGMEMINIQKALTEFVKFKFQTQIKSKHIYLKNGSELKSMLDKDHFVIANVWANYEKPNIGDEEGGHYIVFTGKTYELNGKTFYIASDRYFAQDSGIPLQDIWGFVGITMDGYNRVRFDYDYRADSVEKKEKLMDDNLITQSGLKWHFGEVILVYNK
jgi:hypothetical protein